MVIFQQRKREENIRKREENIRKRELERQQKEKRDAELQTTNEENSPNPRISPDTTAASSQIVKVNFGDDESASLKRRKVKKAKAESIENERLKADQKLQRRLKRAQEKKKNEPKSFGDFTDLEGDILYINVTKIVKKLGIAIDGGANTKQKAVIIREISVSGDWYCIMECMLLFAHYSQKDVLHKLVWEWQSTSKYYKSMETAYLV